VRYLYREHILENTFYRDQHWDPFGR